eukprot:15435731-Alexandrium_andersonii.AAC.1
MAVPPDRPRRPAVPSRRLAARAAPNRPRGGPLRRPPSSPRRAVDDDAAKAAAFWATALHHPRRSCALRARPCALGYVAADSFAENGKGWRRRLTSGAQLAQTCSATAQLGSSWR